MVVVARPDANAAFTASQVRNLQPDETLFSLLDEETTYPHVHADQAVEDALERMEEAGVSAIAVVDRADIRHVLGAVSLADARSAFRASDKRPRQ
jgi:CBS domain-containing protein